MPNPQSILVKAQFYLALAGGVYVSILGLLTVPIVQKHILFLHAVRLPLNSKFDHPAKFGLPVHRTVNLKINTPDNEQLGAWLILPEQSVPSVEPSYALPPPPTQGGITRSLQSRPTFLFFHGNAATRAMSHRISFCKSWSNKFQANVLIIDYRGFADSTGDPSEQGLAIDARAAWTWLVSNGAKEEDIILIGHSLGTGVVSGLAGSLSLEGVHPRGVVLLAPFTSIPEVLADYSFLGGLIPLMQPLQPFPWAQRFFAKQVRHKFNTTMAINSIKVPVMLVHAKDDYEIPSKHSQRLFETALEPLLPRFTAYPHTPDHLTPDEWKEYTAVVEARTSKRAEVVQIQDVDNFGTVSSFSRSFPDGTSAPFVFIESRWGGHDYIGTQETVADLMGRVFELI